MRTLHMGAIGPFTFRYQRREPRSSVFGPIFERNRAERTEDLGLGGMAGRRSGVRWFLPRHATKWGRPIALSMRSPVGRGPSRATFLRARRAARNLRSNRGPRRTSRAKYRPFSPRPREPLARA